MADFTLGVDGYSPAVLTAATRWFWASALGLEMDANADTLPTAVAGRLNVAFDPYQYGANLWTLSAAVVANVTYKMRGMDALVSGLYDTWLAADEPDTDASSYTGALATPLRDVIVIDSWPPAVAPVAETGDTMLQTVITETTAAFSFTGTIPLDNTIPQSTEGVAYPALDTTITPESPLSELLIEVVLAVSASGVTGVTVALFRDAGAGAIASGFTSIESAGRVRAMVFGARVPAGSVSPTTFKLRAGSGGLTAYLNSNGATDLFGGTFIARMTVTEVAA